ncbi:permease [Romboutsia sp. Marseille-P6047]|uniref:permease n=1 Tax=Romboutsia sp. Marseille-P6047 TaxID=2161817 RepID=UPI000F049380|nr:permease [Romboutsia sp. Marseille-P6047]
MTSYILYSIAIVLFILSFIKDKSKTKKAIIKALKSFENIMPQFLSIIIIVGIILSLLDTETISKFIGSQSGFLGVLFSAIVGSTVLMPTFVAFSTADALLKSGAGYAQVAALVSTLTLVGVMTFTLEAKYIGKKAAFVRNFIAFLFSFLVAFFIGVMLG